MARAPLSSPLLLWPLSSSQGPHSQPLGSSLWPQQLHSQQNLLTHPSSPHRSERCTERPMTPWQKVHRCSRLRQGVHASLVGHMTELQMLIVSCFVLFAPGAWWGDIQEKRQEGVQALSQDKPLVQGTALGDPMPRHQTLPCLLSQMWAHCRLFDVSGLCPCVLCGCPVWRVRSKFCLLSQTGLGCHICGQLSGTGLSCSGCSSPYLALHPPISWWSLLAASRLPQAWPSLATAPRAERKPSSACNRKFFSHFQRHSQQGKEVSWVRPKVGPGLPEAGAWGEGHPLPAALLYSPEGKASWARLL